MAGEGQHGRLKGVQGQHVGCTLAARQAPSTAEPRPSLGRKTVTWWDESWCWWCMNVVKGFVVVILAQPSSLVVLVLVCEVGCDGRRAQSNGTLLHKTARVRVACLASGVGQLALREENGLLETFPSMCGSSTPAPSCQEEEGGERRREEEGGARRRGEEEERKRREEEEKKPERRRGGGKGGEKKRRRGPRDRDRAGAGSRR